MPPHPTVISPVVTVTLAGHAVLESAVVEQLDARGRLAAAVIVGRHR